MAFDNSFSITHVEDLASAINKILFKEDNISSNMHKNFVNLGYKQRDLRDIIKKIILN